MSFDVDEELNQTLTSAGHTAESVEGDSQLNKPGYYAFEIEELDREAKQGKTPCIRFDMRIHGGVTSDGCKVEKGGKGEAQLNRILFHRMYTEARGGARLSDGATRITLRFALGLGLITREQIGDPKMTIRWSQARGVRGIVQVMREDDPDGKRGPQFKVAFGQVWPLDHPDVAEVPRPAEWGGKATATADGAAAGQPKQWGNL